MNSPRHVVITGGAGFLGSHLASRALASGVRVTVVDNLSTGNLGNLRSQLDDRNLDFIQADVQDEKITSIGGRGPIDVIFNLASPASPPVYSDARVNCLLTNALGVRNVATLAHKHGARLVQASTSEVYGDPEEHPQTERYLGNVNPVGPRSCYDEGKRYAEAYLAAHRHEQGTNTGIVRIFNTYGPNMSPHDGRVISGFVHQALTGEPLTVYGDGSQTRSFCYVSDLVEAIWKMGEIDHPGPINIGNPGEYTILDLARTVLDLTGSDSPIEYLPLPAEDPTRRRPDIARAGDVLGWRPTVNLREGLRRTIEWHLEMIEEGK